MRSNPCRRSLEAASLALLLLLAARAAAAAAAAAVSGAGEDAGNALDGGGAWVEAEAATAPDRSAKAASLGALGRSVLADLARQLVTNYETNSQVLSLNLTNLLILLVLKALLFGAGMFSFGLLNHKGGGHATGRSSEGSGWAPALLPALSEGELLLAISFLAGDAAAGAAGAEGGPRSRSADGPPPFACLHRVACEQPKEARQYAGAGKLLLKGAKMMESFLPYNPKYETIVSELQRAADYGLNGGECAKRYACAVNS